MITTFSKSPYWGKRKINKLAKAQKAMLIARYAQFEKFGPGKLQVEKVWAKNIFIHFLAELDNAKKINFRPIPGNPTQIPKETFFCNVCLRH